MPKLVTPRRDITESLESLEGSGPRPSSSTKVGIRNSTDLPLELLIEPWGDHIFLVPGIEYVVATDAASASGAPDDAIPDITVEHGSECAVVWSHRIDATLWVCRDDGTVVWASDWTAGEQAALLFHPGSIELLASVAEGRSDALPHVTESDPAAGNDSGGKALLPLVEYALLRQDQSGILQITEKGRRFARRFTPAIPSGSRPRSLEPAEEQWQREWKAQAKRASAHLDCGERDTVLSEALESLVLHYHADITRFVDQIRHREGKQHTQRLVSSAFRTIRSQIPSMASDEHLDLGQALMRFFSLHYELAKAEGNEGPAPTSGRERLTSREADVLTLVASGLTTREVSERLHLSTSTVSSHLKNIYEKLGVHNRAEVIATYSRDHSD